MPKQIKISITLSIADDGESVDTSLDLDGVDTLGDVIAMEISITTAGKLTRKQLKAFMKKNGDLQRNDWHRFSSAQVFAG